MNNSSQLQSPDYILSRLDEVISNLNRFDETHWPDYQKMIADRNNDKPENIVYPSRLKAIRQLTEIIISEYTQNISQTNIKQIAMGCKPDPFKFYIVSTEIINNNTIVLANYTGCLSFNGNKLMLLRGVHTNFESLDPHFLNDSYPVVARFIPNETGMKLAKLCAENL